MKGLLLDLIKQINDEIWNKEEDCSEEAELQYWSAKDNINKAEEHIRKALRREGNGKKEEENVRN